MEVSEDKNNLSIEELASAAQAVPPEYRWIFSRSHILEKAGNPEVVISRFSKIFRIKSLALFVLSNRMRKLLVVGSILSILVLKYFCDWKHLLSGKRLINGTCADGGDYFIGFGAAAETAMLDWYSAESGRVVKYVTGIKSIGMFLNVDFFELMRLTISTYLYVDKYFDQIFPGKRALRFELYMSFVKNVGYYCYWLIFFKTIKRDSLEPLEILVIQPGASAFAAVSAGLKVRYVAHGLLRHSLVFPDFEHVEVMTEYEIKHVQSRLPRLNQITLQRFRAIIPNDSAKKGVLIVSAYGSDKELDLFEVFAEKVKVSGQPLFFRPRPWQKGVDLAGRKNLLTAQIIDQAMDFSDLLNLIEPAYVASTVSAALVDADSFGSIPIVMGSKDDRVMVDMVFPMLHQYCHWPQNESLIQEMWLN